MRLTIDSEDNIDQVLQAVSALFGVQVTTGGDTSGADSGSGQSSAASAPSRRGAKTAKAAKTAKSAPANRGGGRGRTGGARVSRSRPDSGAVREWAKQNGFDVSDRGRIPSRVISAYQEANRG